MTSTIVEEDLITMPARVAAIAWLNAFLAASTDEARPVLFQTLSLEWFDDGLHIVGCDGTALFRTWAPEAEGGIWPDPALKPNRSVVVMDTEGFGIGFMRTLLKVTSDEEREHEKLTIAVAPADEGATLLLGEEFMGSRLVLRACGQRIDLRIYDGEYVKWRELDFGLNKVEQVDELRIATRLFALVGKFKGASAVNLAFHGKQKAVAFIARDGEFPNPQVVGLLMPMRKGEQEDE